MSDAGIDRLAAGVVMFTDAYAQANCPAGRAAFITRPLPMRTGLTDSAPSYPIYAGEKRWTVVPAAALIQQHAATFADLPPRQAPPDFNAQAIDDIALKAAGQRGD